MELNYDSIIRMLDTAFIKPENKSIMQEELSIPKTSYYRLLNQWVATREAGLSEDALHTEAVNIFNHFSVYAFMKLADILDFTYADIAKN